MRVSGISINVNQNKFNFNFGLTLHLFLVLKIKKKVSWIEINPSSATWPFFIQSKFFYYLENVKKFRIIFQYLYYIIKFLKKLHVFVYIYREESKRPYKEFYLFCMPHKSLLCQKKFQNHSVLGNFTLIEEFKYNLFPFNNDCSQILKSLFNKN